LASALLTASRSSLDSEVSRLWVSVVRLRSINVK
jgi:hypothetical protein